MQAVPCSRTALGQLRVSTSGRLKPSRSHRVRVVANWAGVLTCIWVIWGLGGDDFSIDSTSRFLRPLLQWLFGSASRETLDVLHLVVRKGAHALEYGVLALLTLRALTVSWVLSIGRGAVIALGLVLVVAAADEWRQTFSSERQGAWTDVLLDLAGSVSTVGIVQALPRSARQRLVATPN